MAESPSVESVSEDKLVHDTRELADDMREVIGDIRERRLLERYYRENPYVVLGVAAAAGYVAAGGLFTSFTRRLVRIGMKALVVPVAAAQLKNISGSTDIPE